MKKKKPFEKDERHVKGEQQQRGKKPTLRVDSLPHRKWKEIKQQPSMLPGPAVPGCCLISFYFLWGKLSTLTVHYCISIFSKGTFYPLQTEV